MATDDQQIVTTTVAVIKAYENAVHAREDARYTKARASDVLNAAKFDYERAMLAESDAIDAQIAATTERPVMVWELVP